MNKFLYNISLYLRVILMPSCWLQNYEVSYPWDLRLNKLLETEKFVVKGTYNVVLGDIDIWVDNHPYASFRPIRNGFPASFRPKRITILKAHDKFMKDILKSYSKDNT